MVNLLDFRLSSPGLNPNWVTVELLGKTHFFVTVPLST